MALLSDHVAGRAAPLLALVLAAASVTGPTTASAAPPPSQAVSAAWATAPSGSTHTFVYEGREIRLDLHRVQVLAPGFQILTQGADGVLVPRRTTAVPAYLGSVVGQPDSVAVAVRRHDGILAGQVSTDRGATLRFVGRDTVETRGLTPPSTYHWPDADDASRNVTVRRGQVGTVTRRFDLGFDLDASYAVDELGGSVRRAMDAVSLLTVQMLATYERDARLRPALRRVVLRLDDAASPYAGVEGGELQKVRAAWSTELTDDVVDNVALLHDEGGGGVAYVGSVGGSYAVSVNGGGADVDVVRHEVGHNWGPGDNHTNGPEGATIESGNQYPRFDGTELAAIFRTRDARLADAPRRFPVVPASRLPLPPYAALDLRDGLVSGRPSALVPAYNDHDANGSSVRLTTVSSRSHLGGRLVRTGERVTYTPPAVAATDTVDWFRYRVVDPAGRSATGVVVVRVDPA